MVKLANYKAASLLAIMLIWILSLFSQFSLAPYSQNVDCLTLVFRTAEFLVLSFFLPLSSANGFNLSVLSSTVFFLSFVGVIYFRPMHLEKTCFYLLSPVIPIFGMAASATYFEMTNAFGVLSNFNITAQSYKILFLNAFLIEILWIMFVFISFVMLNKSKKEFYFTASILVMELAFACQTYYYTTRCLSIP